MTSLPLPDPDPHTGMGRILLADDDAPFRESTARLLRAGGYNCVCAPDAHNAAERLQTEPFDLLLADIHMPGNSDLEMIRALPPAAAGLPVILLTGDPSIDTAAESVRLSVSAYLIKPPDVDELCALVEQVIAQGRAYRAVDANHQRLRDWCQDIEQLKGALRRPAPGGYTSPWQSFLTLSLSHIIESLVELKDYTEALVQPTNPQAPARTLETSRPLVLLEAIREAVAVLERSKGAFKSRELGELRKKLKALMDGP